MAVTHASAMDSAAVDQPRDDDMFFAYRPQDEFPDVDWDTMSEADTDIDEQCLRDSEPAQPCRQAAVPFKIIRLGRPWGVDAKGNHSSMSESVSDPKREEPTAEDFTPPKHEPLFSTEGPPAVPAAPEPAATVRGGPISILRQRRDAGALPGNESPASPGEAPGDATPPPPKAPSAAKNEPEEAPADGPPPLSKAPPAPSSHTPGLQQQAPLARQGKTMAMLSSMMKFEGGMKGRAKKLHPIKFDPGCTESSAPFPGISIIPGAPRTRATESVGALTDLSFKGQARVPQPGRASSVTGTIRFRRRRFLIA